MSVVIRLSPAGRKNAQVYKVIVAEKGAKLTGRHIEKVGVYTPGRKAEAVDVLSLNKDRYEFWIGKGAIPSETLAKIVTFQSLDDKTKKSKMEKDTAFRKKRAAKAKSAAAPAEAAATPAPAAEAPTAG